MNNYQVQKQFWKWFERNHREYLHLYRKNKKEEAYWLNEMAVHLAAYCQFLGFELFFDMNTRRAKLIISANGDIGYFTKADKLVAKAPAISRWEIISLQEPRPIDFGIEEQFADTGIDPHRLWFAPDNGNDPGHEPGIIVYAELYRPETKPRFEEAVYAIIDNLLGERSAALDIGLITLENLSRVPDKGQLLLLELLPAYVESMQSLVVDARGAIKQVARQW